MVTPAAASVFPGCVLVQRSPPFRQCSAAAGLLSVPVGRVEGGQTAVTPSACYP